MLSLSNSKYDVLCIGPSFMDLFIKLEDDARLDDIGLKRGRCLQIEKEDFDNITTNFHITEKALGGAAPTTADILRQLGASVAYIHRLADDENGQAFLRELERTGVFYNTPLVLNAEATGSCLIFISKDGERSMCPYFGAQKMFSPDDIDENVVKDSSFVYAVGNSMKDALSVEAIKKAFFLAKKYGRKTGLNAFDVNVLQESAKVFKSLLDDGLVDVFFGNVREFFAFWGVDTKEELFEILLKQKYDSVVTLGEGGAAAIVGGELFSVPAKKVAKAIDTTGCGDSFVAGYLFAMLKKRSVTEALIKGTEVAAETVVQVGARPKLSKDFCEF